MGGKGELINRLYLGLETAHTGGSFLLDKNISYEQKLMAAKLIRGAGIPLKVIVQLGVLGEMFKVPDKSAKPDEGPKQGDVLKKVYREVPWEEAIDQTAKWINEARPYRVLFSVYQPDSATKKRRGLEEQGMIVAPVDRIAHAKQERARLMGQLKVNDNQFGVEDGYESFLPMVEPRQKIYRMTLRS